MIKPINSALLVSVSGRFENEYAVQFGCTKPSGPAANAAMGRCLATANDDRRAGPPGQHRPSILEAATTMERQVAFGANPSSHAGLAISTLRKGFEEMKRIHEARLLTYGKLAGMKIVLLMNFNMKKLKDSIKRFVH